MGCEWAGLDCLDWKHNGVAGGWNLGELMRDGLQRYWEMCVGWFVLLLTGVTGQRTGLDWGGLIYLGWPGIKGGLMAASVTPLDRNFDHNAGV